MKGTEGEEYPNLVTALEGGSIQPWKRQDDATTAPEVGVRACLGCLARKAGKALRHLKPYPHTCQGGNR